MTRLAASTIRDELADALNRVRYRRERIVIHRRGTDVAALVPMQDAELLEALEARADLKAALKALKEPGTVPWGEVKAKLGL